MPQSLDEWLVFLQRVSFDAPATLNPDECQRLHNELLRVAEACDHSVSRWVAMALTTKTSDWSPTPEKEALQSVDVLLASLMALYSMSPCESYWATIKTTSLQVVEGVKRLRTMILGLKAGTPGYSKLHLPSACGIAQEAIHNVKAVPKHAFHGFTMVVVQTSHHVKGALNDLGPYTPPDDSTEASTPPEMDDDPLFVVGEEPLLPDVLPVKEELEAVLLRLHAWLQVFLKHWIGQLKEAALQLPLVLRQVDHLYTSFQSLAESVDLLCFKVLSCDIEEYGARFAEFEQLVAQINKLDDVGIYQESRPAPLEVQR